MIFDIESEQASNAARRLYALPSDIRSDVSLYCAAFGLVVTSKSLDILEALAKHSYRPVQIFEALKLGH